MELRQVIGNRRSIRYLLPHKPVERHKIQRMLEAARIASFWGNVQALRAVVIETATAPEELLEALPSPVAGFQVRVAPVVIIWYLDNRAVEEVGTRLRELGEVGAIGYGEQRKHVIEDKLVPTMEGNVEGLQQPGGMNDLDAGQGIAQATLMAFEQGLGTCCIGTPRTKRLHKRLGLPDDCRVMVTQTVGYPAESPEAGGQRPRLPFEQLYSINEYGNPFPRDEAVVDELWDDGMLQEPAPLPWREAELEYLRRALQLTGDGTLHSGTERQG